MKKGWLIPAVTAAALIAVFFIYTGFYYHADPFAVSELESDQAVTVTRTDYGWLFDGPSGKNALIFYPGAKVEETAYSPMLKLLAENGMDVCLVKMPVRFAFFGINKAEKICEENDYENWYVGGHSLGGAMAAYFAAGHGDDLDGVILFSAYPTKQLDPELTEILLYGSNDKILNMKKVEEGRAYAPDEYYEYVIEDGNHAQFGNYGIQSGDGEAKISAQTQQEEAVDYIMDIVSGS